MPIDRFLYVTNEVCTFLLPEQLPLQKELTFAYYGWESGSALGLSFLTKAERLGGIFKLSPVEIRICGPSLWNKAAR